MIVGLLYRIGAVVVLSLVVGACASPPSGPDPGSVGAEPTVENRYGAPPVTEPREVVTRAADPCASLLAPAQIEALNYASPGVPDSSTFGAPICIYRDDDSRRSAHVTVYVGRDLLVDTYRERVLPILIPTVISGLPATHEQSDTDDITCVTVVGIADEQSISVYTTVESQPTGPPLVDPCEDGARVAEAVVSTLPPA